MDGAAVTQSANLTEALAERACAVSYEALPEKARELSRQCVLDYLGVALAGADDPLAHTLLDELAEAGGIAQARVVCPESARAGPPAAAGPGAICPAHAFARGTHARSGHPP